MPNDPEPPAVTGLKRIATAIAVAGNFFPAIGYFTDMAPPLWPTSGVIISAIGLAAFAWMYRRAANSTHPQPWAVYLLIMFLVLIVAYVALLDWTTAVSPASESVRPYRVQIGFGMHYPSLTKEAQLAVDKSEHGEIAIKLDTPAKLMQYFRVWGGANEPTYVWQRWTINTAGGLAVLVFLLAFLAWSSGMAYLLHSL